MGMSFLEEEKDCRLPGLLYAGNLDLCGKSKEDLKVVVKCIVEMCRRRGLKVNADNMKVMVSFEEEILGCEISVDGFAI